MTDPPPEARAAGRRALLWALLALCACAACMGTVLAAREIGNYGQETDFYWKHVPNARDLLRGMFPAYGNKMPLYSTLLAAASLVTGEWFVTALVISAVCALATLAVLGRLAWEWSDRWEAAPAALILAVGFNPVFFRSAVEVGRDPLFVLLSVTGVWAVCRARTGRGLLLAAGVALLATLARQNGVALLPALAVRAGQLAGWRRRAFVRRAWLPCAAFGAGLGGWMALKKVCTGRGGLLLGGSVRQAMGREALRAAGGGRRGVAVAYALWAWVGRCGGHLLAAAGTVLGWPAVLLTGAGGAVLAWGGVRRSWRGPSAVTAVYVAACWLVTSFSHFEPRYALPYVFWPLVLVLSGLAAGAEGVPARRWRRAAALLVAAGCLAAQGRGMYRLVTWLPRAEPRELLAFVEPIRRSVPADGVVAVFKPHIGFYTGRHWVRVARRAAADVPAFLEAARQSGATHILFTAKEAAMYPACAALQHPVTVPDGLRLLARTDRGALYALTATLEASKK